MHYKEKSAKNQLFQYIYQRAVDDCGTQYLRGEGIGGTQRGKRGLAAPQTFSHNAEL